MAISRIGSGSAEATTVTIPAGHQTGDLMIIWAWNPTSSTTPTLPTSWTSENAQSIGSPKACRLGWKVAGSSSETSGTWTNAVELICVVYRGTDEVTPFSSGTTAATNSDATSSVLYLGQTGNTGDIRGLNNVWVLAFSGMSTTDTSLETPPTNLSLVQSQAGATAEAAAFDSNGIATIFKNSTIAVGGTAGKYMTLTLLLRPPQMMLNNYQFVKVGDGMSISEKIR